MLHGTTKAKKCSQEKSCLFPFAIIHILMLIFLTSCPSYRPKYFKDWAASRLPCHLSPLTVCNLKFSWQWTMTSQFCIPMAIYHSYHWPYSIWCYFLQTSIWEEEKKKKKNSLLFWFFTIPNTDLNPLFLHFLCLPLWFLPSSFLLGVTIYSGSGLSGLCPGTESSKPSCLSHWSSLFLLQHSFSHLNAYSFYWSPCF